MAKKQPKLRTFEDVFHRIRWDDTYAIDEMIIGYEDRLLGAMEMPLSEFVPIGEGGDLPMHRVWYVRCGDRVLWDRRRKLDLIFGSGMTWAMSATEARCSDEETLQRISAAKANIQMIEEEKQHKLDVQLHAQRHAEKRMAGLLPRPPSIALTSSQSASRKDLTMALFRLCDGDGDGFLCKGEMYIFAKATGFDGDAGMWTEEFGLLCSEHAAKVDVGIDAIIFEKLINDESDSGCFCSDTELQQTAALVRQSCGLPPGN